MEGQPTGWGQQGAPPQPGFQQQQDFGASGVPGHFVPAPPPPPPPPPAPQQQGSYEFQAEYNDPRFSAPMAAAGGAAGGPAGGWAGEHLTEEQYARMTPEQQAALWSQYEQYYGGYQQGQQFGEVGGAGGG